MSDPAVNAQLDGIISDFEDRLVRRIRFSSQLFPAFLDPTLLTALLPRTTGFSKYTQDQTRTTGSIATTSSNSDSVATGV